MWGDCGSRCAVHGKNTGPEVVLAVVRMTFCVPLDELVVDGRCGGLEKAGDAKGLCDCMTQIDARRGGDCELLWWKM